MEILGNQIADLLTGSKSKSPTSKIRNILRDELKKQLKALDVNIDLDFDVPFFSDVKDFTENIEESGVKLLKKTPKILKYGKHLTEELIDLGEELPTLFSTILEVGEDTIQLLPRIIVIIDKLLLNLVKGLAYVVDPENRKLLIATSVSLFLLWAMKDNTLIY